MDDGLFGRVEHVQGVIYIGAALEEVADVELVLDIRSHSAVDSRCK
jgi:hypothetical protein